MSKKKVVVGLSGVTFGHFLVQHSKSGYRLGNLTYYNFLQKAVTLASITEVSLSQKRIV